MTKNKKTFLLIYFPAAIVLSLGLISAANIAIKATMISVNFINNPLGDTLYYSWAEVPTAKAASKVYAYNELVPEFIILDEMRILSQRFNINPVNWEKILRCEATCNKDYCVKGELNNLATNPSSTAVGIAQYLIGTWDQTESWKQYRRARTDYKAALWEMALDISQDEDWRWQECLDIVGIDHI